MSRRFFENVAAGFVQGQFIVFDGSDFGKFLDAEATKAEFSLFVVQ